MVGKVTVELQVGEGPGEFLVVPLGGVEAGPGAKRCQGVKVWVSQVSQ